MRRNIRAGGSNSPGTPTIEASKWRPGCLSALPVFTVLVSSGLETGALHIHSRAQTRITVVALFSWWHVSWAHVCPLPQPRVLFQGPQSGSRLALNVTFATDMHGSVSPTLTGEKELMEHTCPDDLACK